MIRGVEKYLPKNIYGANRIKIIFPVIKLGLEKILKFFPSKECVLFLKNPGEDQK